MKAKLVTAVSSPGEGDSTHSTTLVGSARSTKELSRLQKDVITNERQYPNIHYVIDGVVHQDLPAEVLFEGGGAT